MECIRCTAEFTPRRSDALYCSRQCKEEHVKERRKVVQVCAQCGNEYAPQKRARSGVANSYCSRECKTRAKVESGEAAAANLRSYYRRRYGLTIEEAEVMRAGGCQICGETDGDAPGRHGKLHIDHDHVTGRVRGVLCTNCNSGIGRFADNPELLRRAVEYLSGRLDSVT